MTRYLLNRLRMLRTTTDHFDEHPDLWNTLAPIVDALAPVRAARTALETTADIQADSDTRGLTADKARARDTATEQLVDLGRKTAAHAITIGDSDLQRAVDHSTSDWGRLAEDRFIADANSALTRIEAILPDLAPYDVTPDHLTAARASLADVRRLAGRRDNVAADRTDATDDLDQIYSDAVEPLGVLDRLVPALITDAAFVDQYRIARRIPGD